MIDPKLFINVITYNIRYGGETEEQLAGIAAILEKVNPDVIGLNEVRRYWWGHDGYIDHAEWLAQRIGIMHHFLGVTIDSDRDPHPVKWHKEWHKGYWKIQQGNAMLSRYPFGDLSTNNGGFTSQSCPMAIQINDPTHYVGNRDTEPRNCLVAKLKLDDERECYFLTTHLTRLTKEMESPARKAEASRIRCKQVERLLKITRKLQGQPIVLVGDFNAEPSSPEISLLKGTFTDASVGIEYTHLEDRTKIDYIFVSEGMEVVSRMVPESDGLEQASDHLPIMARLKFTI
jgi:endonuclease/exonuclease/phosphatase family metal-dependent hydrolase